ncbi:MAG TPA: hypothetical protein VF868_11035 [Bacteroidia bacterium]|jgi:hypothetical protein
MQTRYFRVNKEEYCHVTDEAVFITNSKTPQHIPLEHELGEGWGIISVLNYITFFFLFVYTAVSATYYGIDFIKEPLNYGALFLLFLSFKRMQNGFNGSRTPTIQRSKIKNVLLKTPRFSYPRVVIYFEGPEGKTLRRIIRVLYKQEALPVLQETGLLK